MNYGTSQNEPLFGNAKKYKYPENDPDYKGEPLTEDLASGIIYNRGCTDLFFCLVFLAFWVGMIVIAIFAFKSGQPNRLASPFDTDGNFINNFTL